MSANGGEQASNRRTEWITRHFLGPEIEVFDPDFQREALRHGRKRENDLTFLAQFLDDTAHSVEDSAPNPHARPDLNAGVRAKNIAFCQAKPYAFEFLAAYGVASAAAQ